MSKGFANKAVVGPQSTLHTAAATPPVILRHPVSMIKEINPVEFPDEINGFHIRAVDRSYTPFIGATWEMQSGVANYEENLPLVLNCASVDQNDGTADGAASSGFVRTYTFNGTNNTAQQTPQYLTVQTGDEVAVLEMEDGICTDFTLEFANNQAVMLGANFTGRQASAGTFYASAAVTAGPEDVIANKGTVYIGNSTGTFGSLTQKTGTILSGTLNVTTGYKWRTTLDGALYPTDIIFDGEAFSATMELTFVHNSNAGTELTAWRAGTLRMIELEFKGSAYGTAGTGTLITGGYKGLVIRALGKYTDFSSIERDNGSSIVTASFEIGWSIVDNHSLEIIVANEDETGPVAS